MINKVMKILIKTLQKLEIPVPEHILVERSRTSEHGHFATNLAMVLTKVLRKNPMIIAEEIVNAIEPEEDFIQKVEVKKPGFINFFLTENTLQNVVLNVLERNENFGKSELGKGKKVQVEFVSANPTGPLTVGHGRQAVLGDCIARILEWNGYEVEREYYYNDAGRQMRILGLSTYHRYKQILGSQDPMPEDYYQGEYIRDIAQKIAEEQGDKYINDPDNDIFKNSAEKAVFEDIEATLRNLDIHFDRYYNERTLYEDGRIEKVLEDFKKIDAIYEKDGAIWFKGTEFGVDTDRVLWKSVINEATYRLPDIAYHRTKFERGYDKIIDVFGADHHATYPDVLAGLKALNYETNRINVIIHQFVTLTRGGEKVKMSTRKANFVTLDELADIVGKDVVRYFFIMRNANSHLDFDLELAVTEGDENPVFYLQYATARISSIFRKADKLGIDYQKAIDLSVLVTVEELNLMYTLAEFGEVVETCEKSLEPQQIANYLQKLATAFHKFYSECVVISSDEKITHARLLLAKATRIVLVNGLQMLGVSAPEKM
ncbi:MAG: arginine--tRNA ligase [Candidatus Marinimicrobia bacterium]|nr:arginine--tRNA ligase [Candidatus Neomarinimicrobiota bacterium]